MEHKQTNIEQGEDEIHFLDLLLVLVKHKLLIIGFTIIAAIASVVYSLCLPNIYTATAKVIPPQKEGGNISAALGQLGGLASLAGLGSGFAGSTDLYLSILNSRSVADAVIKRPEVMQEFAGETPDAARKIFTEKVRFFSNPKDGIITITADNKLPEMAAKLANATVEELGRRTVALNLAKVSNERLFLEKRLGVVKQDLKKAEEEMKLFAKQNKAIQVDSQAKASIESLAKLRAELASKEVQLAALRSYQTDESPDVRSLLAATNRLKSELSRFTGSGGGAEGIPSIGNVPNLGLEYARRLRDVKIQEAIFEQLTKQNELAKVNENRDTSSLQILDAAVTPDRKSKPKRSQIVILTTLTSFMVAIFFAFVAEYKDKLGDRDRQRWQMILEELRFHRKP